MASKKDDGLSEKMMELFAGRMDVSGTHGEPRRNGLKWEIKNTAQSLREPVTLDLWKKHLSGERPLGVIPIDQDACCRWGSIDYDEYDVDLVKLIRAAERWPLVPCRSKSGGLHLFLFTSEPVPAGDMISTLRAVAAAMGIAGSEIFPKQAQVLADRGDMGNWIVMPYFGDTFGGKLKNQFGLKKNGSEMTLSEFVSAATAKRISAEKFEALARSTRGSKVAAATTGGKKSGKKSGTVSPGDFGDGPPCLQHMSRGGFPEGGRNNALFMIGLYLKQAFPADWKKKLEEDNQKFMKPPLTADEVTQVRKQLDKKDYEYTCRNEPMASHCDAGLCRTRRFGVGDTGEYPSITSMSKMNSDPAIWFLSLGDKRVEIGTQDLLNYSRFQVKVAEDHGIVYNTMKQSDWIKVVSEATATMEMIDPPPETTRANRFQELLEDFLTNRSRGRREEDLLMGRPFFSEEHSRHYFRLRDLDDFMKRAGVKDFTRGQLSWGIKQLEGKRHQLNVKGKCLSVFYVPAGSVGQTPDVEPEKLREEEV